MTSRVSSMLLPGNSRNVNIFLSIFPDQKLIIHVIIWHVGLALNIIEKMQSLNTGTFVFTATRTRTLSQGCGVCSCSLLAKTNTAVLICVILPSLVSKVQKTSSGLEPRTVFRGCGLCSCNFPAETTLVLTLFFYRAYFPSHRNHPRQVSNPGQFSVLCPLFL
jgi:hypothetical protein